MDGSRLRNYFIALLLLLNAFMLVIVGAEQAESISNELAVERDLKEIYEKNGIILEDFSIIDNRRLCSYRLSRDIEKEQAVVRTILGENADGKEESGNIMHYESPKGSALFRGTGDFEITFKSDNTSKSSGSPEDQTKELFQKLSPDSKGTVYTVEKYEDGSSFAEAVGTFNGMPLFNYKVVFDFSTDSCIDSIRGVRIFDTASENQWEQSIDAETALIRFLEQTSHDDRAFTKVFGLSQGFVMYSQVSGTSDIFPVWKIETNAGEFFLNGLYGNLENGVR